MYEGDAEYDFLFRDGKVLPIGEKLFRKGYAKTLQAMAEDGAGAFYEGAIAQALVDAVRAKGGLMSLEDLQGERLARRI